MIDLRSDTVTKPSDAMRAAMAEADVGDDVYNEDPTVNTLQDRAAAITGMDASLFTASGTQSNLMALLCHGQRGDEFIAGQDSHIYLHEAGGAAVLGGLQPQPTTIHPNGEMDLDVVEGLIKPDDPHYARTKILSVENTYGGVVLGLDYLKRVRAFCDAHGLLLHLDGARLFNAAVALNVEPREITRYFDSVAFCLSKGLGTPVGSMLCGTKDVIERAVRWRKMLGGAMRQVGVLAAAGLYALDHNIDCLSDDHANAARLAAGLEGVGFLAGRVRVNTNILFLDITDEESLQLEHHFAKDEIISQGQRLVTHLDVTTKDIDRVIDSARVYFSGQSNP